MFISDALAGHHLPTINQIKYLLFQSRSHRENLRNLTCNNYNKIHTQYQSGNKLDGVHIDDFVHPCSQL